MFQVNSALSVKLHFDIISYQPSHIPALSKPYHIIFDWHFFYHQFFLLSYLSFCEDDRYQKQDRDCWMGSHLGDYTHKVMDMHSQKYNPEVPTLQNVDNERLHQLNDQLITLKNMVNKQVRREHIFESAFDNQVSHTELANEAN